jgi:hypothetical protein
MLEDNMHGHNSGRCDCEIVEEIENKEGAPVFV